MVFRKPKNYYLYKKMLILGKFCKTQSDQNIHQNAPNCTKVHCIFKISRGSICACTEPLADRCNFNKNCFHI